ncbi:MAG: hypothetical protein NUW12_11385 [Firmicutes bacterium]|jgi:hypothetical protein|nr:hypothetical protein [Bacillota bacterium]MDH7495307.1 hypothetical protein [Bacillota bacterium]
MQFVIRGTVFNLSMADVEEKLEYVEPEGKSKYLVRVNGKAYPIKQVISQVTGLPPIGFTSQDAYRILSRLGFRVEQDR